MGHGKLDNHPRRAIIRNRHWPTNQTPQRGKFPSERSLNECSFGMHELRGTGSVKNLKRIMKQLEKKRLYQVLDSCERSSSCDIFEECYIGFTAAASMSVTIGQAVWRSYPRLYGNQATFIDDENFRFLGAVSSMCDVFHQIDNPSKHYLQKLEK